jgi:GDP-L-fucose synthase
MNLKKNKILVLGSTGFLGKNLSLRLKQRKIKFSILTKKECNLLDYNKLLRILSKKKPNIIFNCAGKIGGIGYNINNPSEIFYENIKMMLNIFKVASSLKVKKLINIGSSCCYPSKFKKKLKETNLFEGELHPTVEAYGFWKLASIIGAKAFNKENKLTTINLIFPSLYGPMDKFDQENSHVISSLIVKFYNASKMKKKSLTLWGTGNPIREFIFIDDAIEVLIKIAENYSSLKPINAGVGKGYKIKKIAFLLKKIYNFKGKILWDKSKPDGQKLKLLDNNLIKNQVKWKPKIDINLGLLKTVLWFKKNKKNV